MLVCCRRVFCLELGTGARLLHRWVPSELNKADGASRRWEGRGERWRGEGAAAHGDAFPDAGEPGASADEGPDRLQGLAGETGEGAQSGRSSSPR